MTKTQLKSHLRITPPNSYFHMASVHTHPLPDNAFPTAGPPWDANVLPVPRPPPGALLPQRRLVPVQPRDHAVGPQNAMVSKWHRDLSCSRTLIYVCSH
jgi:hypothetical protein